MSTFILLTILPTCDEWTFPSLLFGWIHFHFRCSRSDFSFLFCILLHIHRQCNRTVYHGGDTDVPGLRRYRPDAVPVETRLLPASSRFITVFDSLPGYSRWVPVVLNILKQPGTWAGLTRFNTANPGSPRLSTVPPRLWHGSSRFIPDHQTGVNRHFKPGQWERGFKCCIISGVVFGFSFMSYWIDLNWNCFANSVTRKCLCIWKVSEQMWNCSILFAIIHLGSS